MGLFICFNSVVRSSLVNGSDSGRFLSRIAYVVIVQVTLREGLMYAEPGLRVSAGGTPVRREPGSTGLLRVCYRVSCTHCVFPRQRSGSGDMRISTWLPSRVAPKTVRPPTPFPDRTRGKESPTSLLLPAKSSLGSVERRKGAVAVVVATAPFGCGNRCTFDGQNDRQFCISYPSLLIVMTGYHGSEPTKVK